MIKKVYPGARVHEQSEKRIKDKIRELTKRNWSVSLDYRFLKLKQVLVGWINYFKIAKCRSFLMKLDQMIRRRIRAVIWKTWKKVRTRIQSLVKLGVPKQKALEWANTRKGYARISNSYILSTTITNKILEKRGLTSALKYYTQCTIR